MIVKWPLFLGGGRIASDERAKVGSKLMAVSNRGRDRSPRFDEAALSHPGRESLRIC